MRRTFAILASACAAALALMPAGPARPQAGAEPLPPPRAPPLSEALPRWSPGELDIHHISTGRGNAAYLILPDGTTLLIDAGAGSDFSRLRPLIPFDARPDASRTPATWIADYIRQFAPPGRAPAIDYALISHFHSDHYGAVTAASPLSANGAYRLSGITEVAELLPVRTLLDRAAPDYMAPIDLRRCRESKDNPTFANYLAFVDHRRARGEAVAGLTPGKLDQIALVHAPARYPRFHIRNIAASGRLWTGHGDGVTDYIPYGDIKDCGFDENPFSNVIRLSYGKFDYYSGGDIPGVPAYDQPFWRDVETPVSAVVGPVDVMTLDHHGNRDAINGNLLRNLRPRVIVQQNWLSPQPSEEVVWRMASQGYYPGPRDVFSTGMRPETRASIGQLMDSIYKSFEGHVVIRVAPGGDSYMVFILNDKDARRPLIARFGPYMAD
ncbi:MBL fold metallo-hydrolase [Sphingomonas sanxanigenens]|uniref:Metallo-beta-lactamase domain-containing protein n=1 Tax=Sphingomonas sanxanigenens DSM 19645 = NX02 TaxID=1123269 RepID=W0AG94_9SPHN|nr:MBL fold metallo-hydrolase [Sphingomonas sanxanigenens]AHE55308.1 hypothetical protein NX02_18195 [Sphingomonas sanxanigenens DSM 19645 = NX02]